MEKEFLEGLGLNEETVAVILERHQLEQQAHQEQMAALRFDSALEQAVTKAGGRNITAIRALLDLETLASADADAMEKALKNLKKECGYLFADATPPAYAPGTGTRQTSPVDEPKSLADALREKFKKK